MRHGSLFSGIGGFDLAAAWMGWQNIFHCEKDIFCQNILKHYWPQSKCYEDIKTFDAVKYRGLVDIISGGFPCQPFSQAGRRKGKDDDRYLWPEALRIITEAKPRWIVLENVAGLFTILEQQGISEMEVKTVELFCADETFAPNRTIIRLQRRIIGTIISEIGAAGYLLPQLSDGTPIVLCIPACAVNAPHRRDRVWFVAYAGDSADRPDKDQLGRSDTNRTADKGGWEEKAAFHQGCADRTCDGKGPDTHCHGHGQNPCDSEYEIITGEAGKYAQYHTLPFDFDVTDPGGKGLEGQGQTRNRPCRRDGVPDWNEWPTQSPVCGRDDGVPRELDGITFPRWRNESVKAYGNAIVPQVALEMFSVIQIVEDQY